MNPALYAARVQVEAVKAVLSNPVARTREAQSNQGDDT